MACSGHVHISAFFEFQTPPADVADLPPLMKQYGPDHASSTLDSNSPKFEAFNNYFAPGLVFWCKKCGGGTCSTKDDFAGKCQFCDVSEPPKVLRNPGHSRWKGPRCGEAGQSAFPGSRYVGREIFAIVDKSVPLVPQVPSVHL